MQVPRAMMPRLRYNYSWAVLTLAACLLFAAPTAPAQGCSQCRDNVAAAPARVQQAFRHGIIFLGAAACALFAATLVVAYRQKRD